MAIKELSRRVTITEEHGAALVDCESAALLRTEQLLGHGLLESIVALTNGPIIKSGLYLLHVGDVREIEIPEG